MRAHLLKRLLVVTVAAGVLTASAGCSSSSEGGAPAPPPPDGIFRIGLEKPESLDPAQARFPAEVLLAEQLFDGLTTYDPVTLGVVPAVAASWAGSENQKEWEFTLRPDAVFSNGRQITSADVKYTFERIASRGSGSPVASLLEQVDGFRAFSLEGDAEELTGITAPSPDKVVFSLDNPFSAFPAVVGNPAFGIVPKEAVEGPDPPFSRQPLGSGPFMITSRDDAIIRLGPGPGGRTALQGVEVHLGADSARLFEDFNEGRLDWAPAPTEGADDLDDDVGRKELQPYPAELIYGFNLENPKFRDVRFREAIVRAVDRDAIVRVVFSGRVRPAPRLVADGIPGAQPDACGEKCVHDPERARALLREAFGDGAVPEVNIDFDDDPTQRAVTQAMEANLEAVGIPVNLRPHEYSEYLRFAVSGDQELFRLAWIGAYPTPDAFLTPLFLGGSPENVTGFANADVDRLLGEARAQPDEAVRVGLYQQAERITLEQVPVVPLAQYETHSVVAKRVKGLVMSAFGTFDAARVTLDAG